ncbi:MAG: glycosyltransferase family 4 protein [Verrucomicrobia bacterium]|nr:glycosyltransferase family 4 protein [Verrucomicrobiota bacterium]
MTPATHCECREVARTSTCNPAKKLAWLVHSPTPYKAPFFVRLAAQPEVYATFLFLYWDDPQRSWTLEALPGVKYKVLPGFSLRRRLREKEHFHFGPAVIRELWRGRFDLVVVCGYGHPTLLLAIVYCLVTGTPFVLQGESHVVQQRHVLKKALKRWLLFPLLRRATAAFATGQKATDYWAEVGIPRKKIFILSNTPDVEFFVSNSDRARSGRLKVRAALGLDNRRSGIYVGRFVAAKGIEVLLIAIAALESTKRPQLLLVGDGPLKARYEEIIQRHNLPVKLIGFQQKEQLPEYYAAADFFVLPSLSEPWGVVVNEAMACGLPVLLSDQVGAAYDLLEEGRNGFMLSAGDVAAWTKGLERIMALSDAELTRMGVTSREIVRPWNHEANVKSVLECVKMVWGRKQSKKKQKWGK